MDIHIESALLAQLLDEHAIVSVTDAAGDITYVNQKFLDISGYSLPELIGQNHRILKSGIHTPVFYQELWDTLLSGKTWQGEVCNRRKNGTLYWVRASVKPVLDAIGLPVQYISIRTDITEIKHAEESARCSQLLIRSVFDAIPDLIFYKDCDGKYLGCNRAFELYFNAPEASIIGKTDFDFVDQQTATSFRKQDELMLVAGAPRSNEEWITYPDGRKVLMEVVKMPYDYGGMQPGVIGVGHDITRRKQQIQAIEESESRWAFAVEGAGDGVWDWDMRTGHMLFSRLYEAMLGYDEHELPQTADAWIKSVHPADLSRVQDTLQKYLAGTFLNYVIELRLQCKEGGYKWVLCRGTVVERDAEGKPVRMIGIHSDISERKQGEQQLELFREMIENTGQPVFLIDVEDGYRLVYVNQAACKHWGASKEELLTWRIPDWDPTFDEERTKAHFVETVGKPGVIMETKHLLKDGRIVPVELFVNARMIAGKSYIFGSFLNISERKKSENSLLFAKESAERANSAKSDFLSSMSHELRTPMNAILGFAQLMEGDAAITEDQRENLQQISRAGWHLLDLINEVLDLARVESGEIKLAFESVDLADMVSECLSLVRPLSLHKRINVVNSVGADTPRMRADYLRLKQVLINLLSNAIKYNVEGGQVRINVSIVDDDKLAIVVRDTGRGMTPEQMAKLFEPFSRFGDTEAVQGTGIGLSISKKLIERMGGEILAESVYGAGSMFSIVLPRADMSDMKLPSKQDVLSLLYIEDDAAQQFLLGKWASKQGWAIEFAHDAASGIDAAMKCVHDVIFLDIDLPGGFSGLDVKSVLDDMESLRAIPVIGISSLVQEQDIERAMQAGFAAYLLKPVDLIELARVIHSLVRGGEKA